MYQLYIANKNYSSWSLRPWLLLCELNIPFIEHSLRFGDHARWQEYRRLSPGGMVPALIDNGVLVWESISIVEYLAERHAGVWPEDPVARAWARSAAAEMHSGFVELRNRCSMSCGIEARLKEFPAALERDVARLSALWNEGLDRFGGPFLAGSRFTAVDAFFAPVAFRVRSYALTLDPPAARYAQRLLDLRSMRDWYAAALAETTRDAPHEAEIGRLAEIVKDQRAT